MSDMSSNQNLLLSKDRRAKVEARVSECLRIAAAKYKQDFEMPEIRYDVKNTDGGTATFQQWLIRLNLILMVENEENFIKTTVAHEVAHLVARRVYHAKVLAETGKNMRPHGKEWKEVMELFQIPVKVTHSYDCTSIQRVTRRPRGSKLDGKEADVLLHRLTVASKRLSKQRLSKLIGNLLTLQQELT